MNSIEEIQMERYANELEDDMNHLVAKYQRIMGWGVPDLDEQVSRKLILEALYQAIRRIDNGADAKDGYIYSGGNYLGEINTDDVGDLARAVQNPIADLISVPLQNNTNFNFGPREKTQNVLNIQPVVPIDLSDGVATREAQTTEPKPAMVTIPSGTRLVIRTSDSIDSRRHQRRAPGRIRTRAHCPGQPGRSRSGIL